MTDLRNATVSQSKVQECVQRVSAKLAVNLLQTSRSCATGLDPVSPRDHTRLHFEAAFFFHHLPAEQVQRAPML